LLLPYTFHYAGSSSRAAKTSSATVSPATEPVTAPVAASTLSNDDSNDDDDLNLDVAIAGNGGLPSLTKSDTPIQVYFHFKHKLGVYMHHRCF
jgi:hypothetical protein